MCHLHPTSGAGGEFLGSNLPVRLECRWRRLEHLDGVVRHSHPESSRGQGELVAGLPDLGCAQHHIQRVHVHVEERRVLIQGIIPCIRTRRSSTGTWTRWMWCCAHPRCGKPATSSPSGYSPDENDEQRRPGSRRRHRHSGVPAGCCPELATGTAGRVRVTHGSDGILSDFMRLLVKALIVGVSW